MFIFFCRLLFGACLVLAVAAPLAMAQTPDHAVILMYHHVSSQTPASTSVTPELFADHLAYLEENHFRIWPLPAVVDSLRLGGSLPDSVVVITFDDGYRSVYEEAFPLLKQKNWPFTVFVCSDAIDHQSGPVLDWEKLKEMGQAGGTIASHGQSHRHHTRLLPGENRQAWQQRTLAEFRHSQTRIEAETGQNAQLLAYPYGEYDPDLQAIVEQLGWAAVGQHSGAAGALSPLSALPRFPMAAGFAAMKSFPTKVGSLPLPVQSFEAEGLLVKFGEKSVILSAEPPVLGLTLVPGSYQTGQLSAYASNQGRALVRWLDRSTGSVEIQAEKNLRPGRNRYNITAPSLDGKRWYWYSHTWIVGDQHSY